MAESKCEENYNCSDRTKHQKRMIKILTKSRGEKKDCDER